MPRSFTGASRRGFTLIELMIVVAIIGILAVLAIYGVSRYLRTSKTAEATNNVGAITKNAVSAFTREKMSGSFLAGGTSVAGTYGLCGPSTRVPANTSSIMAAKYQSSPTEWTSGDTQNGWNCLKFDMIGPQYYSYKYDALTTAGSGSFTATANGDLDGNSTTSAFVMSGSVLNNSVLVSPKPLETSPEE